MTKDEFVQASMDIYVKNKELQVLADQRRAEEQALCDEYKVDECNSKRALIIKKYQDLINSKKSEIKSVEDSLGA